MTQPDPRFLAGEEAVITDVAQTRWAVVAGWDGAVDIHGKVDRAIMAAELRYVADHLDPSGRRLEGQ